MDILNSYARYTFVTITVVAVIQIVAMVLTALSAVAIRHRVSGDSRFTSRQGLNSSYASAPMLSRYVPLFIDIRMYHVTHSQPDLKFVFFSQSQRRIGRFQKTIYNLFAFDEFVKSGAGHHHVQIVIARLNQIVYQIVI